MRARVRAAAVAVALLTAGCGAPPADLFVVERTGTIPGARLTLLVSDDGMVRCNGGAERDMGSDRLLDAREIARDLLPGEVKRRALAPGPRSILRYRVRLEDGTVSFSDTSRGQSLADRRLAAFTRTVAKEVCGLTR